MLLLHLGKYCCEYENLNFAVKFIKIVMIFPEKIEMKMRDLMIACKIFKVPCKSVFQMLQKCLRVLLNTVANLTNAL